MSGFDLRWLALREPVDRRSRDPDLQNRTVRFLREASRGVVLDIGCGTGSTYRALAPELGKAISWRLFDNDDRLLAEARRWHPEADITFVSGDLNQIASLPLEDVTLVTASAVFDLCSAVFIDGLLDALRGKGIGLYAALNYDGDMHWSVSHPLDQPVREAFNRHQLNDKGFGPSAGPNGWTRLSAGLEARGYEVRLAESHWRMGEADTELQRLLLAGIVDALAGAALLPAGELADWHAFRLGALTVSGSSCVVGHRDVLALP